MDPKVQACLDAAKQLMEKAITHLESELTKVRAGKASPSMLDAVMVDYYGTKMPLNQTANVNTLDARTLIVQPWEKSMLEPISKAIIDANLNLNPQNDGSVIRINVPSLTEERRKDLVKKAKTVGEDCKVTLRTIRKDANDSIKKLKANGLPEDEAKEGETKVQQLTDSYGVKADKHLEAKEKEVMTV
ncbi:MAG: ribosome recycling factor [Bacteroidetes bacterium]|nr:ribosome recycling factor [Bacteroidota bacterium]